MKIKRREKDNWGIIKIIGEISSDEVFKLSKAIEGARERGRFHIAVDVAEAGLLDSSALGVLILNLKILKKAGGDLCLLSPTSYIQDLLHNSNLDTVFRIAENEDQL